MNPTDRATRRQVEALVEQAGESAAANWDHPNNTWSESKHMFTGLIEECGVIEKIRPLGKAGRRLTVAAKKVLEDLKVGSSIAVDGVCLTAVRVDSCSFDAELSRETIARSNFGTIARGTRVNLERPLALHARLGGHWVQGHVDAVATFLRAKRWKDSWSYWFQIPRDFSGLVVFKGSIAISGISLTVAKVLDDKIKIAIIPHTYRKTNLRFLKRGDTVNVEFDILAKYVQKMLESQADHLSPTLATPKRSPRLTMAALKAQGF